MNHNEIYYKLGQLIHEVRTAVLSTIDKDGKPHARWMTPTLLGVRHGAIYAVSCPRFDWVKALDSHADVEWMFQSHSLNEILRIRGKIRAIDNPSLKADILEEIGSRLTVFWKVNSSATDFIVLETVIEEASYFLPMEGKRTDVKFPTGYQWNVS